LFINLTPFKHPEKSLIFLGTRLYPPLLEKERGRNEKEGAKPPLRHPIRELKRGEA